MSYAVINLENAKVVKVVEVLPENVSTLIRSATRDHAMTRREVFEGCAKIGIDANTRVPPSKNKARSR